MIFANIGQHIGNDTYFQTIQVCVKFMIKSAKANKIINYL